MIKLISRYIIMFCTIQCIAQSFEGTITYKLEMINPYPDRIADTIWQAKQQEQYGEKAYAEQKYFYKENKYRSEIENEFEKKIEVLQPDENLIYYWEASEDTAVTKKSNFNYDDFFEITDTEDVDTVLNIACKSIILKSKFQKMKIWYNPDYLQVKPELFKYHLHNHLKQIFAKIKCLPLKIEKYGTMGKLVQTATAFNAVPIGNELFIIPDFEKIDESKDN